MIVKDMNTNKVIELKSLLEMIYVFLDLEWKV